jgi:hypothetical protein
MLSLLKGNHAGCRLSMKSLRHFASNVEEYSTSMRDARFHRQREQITRKACGVGVHGSRWPTFPEVLINQKEASQTSSQIFRRQTTEDNGVCGGAEKETIPILVTSQRESSLLWILWLRIPQHRANKGIVTTIMAGVLKGNEFLRGHESLILMDWRIQRLRGIIFLLTQDLEIKKTRDMEIRRG